MNSIIFRSLLVSTFLLISTGTANADKNNLAEILNVTRCTYQWDFMLRAFGARQGKASREATRKDLRAQWIRPKAKKEFIEVSDDALNSALDYVYGLNPMPVKTNKVLLKIHEGFMQCVKKRKLQKFERELTTASSRAGLATLWDYYHHNGITKEQILENSNLKSKYSRKILDDVYSPNFNAQRYRVYDIWNPVTAYIAKKYHGVNLRLPAHK